MASGGQGSDRAPQFTESHYEIPSWQIPWNKPWYQWDEKRSDKKPSSVNRRVDLQYNNRGHLIDCNCTDCEDDLETAFVPQANNNPTIFNIHKDRHKDIDVELIENLETPKQEQDGGHGKNETLQTNPAVRRENVILLSELPEYVPPSSSAVECSALESGSTSTNSLSASSSPNNLPPMSHESVSSVMDSFSSLVAIQGVSDKARDIQTRVHRFSGTRDTRDYIVMKDILRSLQRELGRIQHNDFEWLQMARNMALEAVSRTLYTLEQKVTDEDP